MKAGFLIPVKLMLQSAFWHSLAKILLFLVLSIALPLNILLTQQVVDSLTGFVTGGETVQALFFWGAMLVLSMAAAAVLGGYVGNVLEISLARKLTKSLSPRFLDKFRRINYSCFEDREAMDIIARMGDEPHKKYQNMFNKTLEFVSGIIGMIGIGLILLQAAWWFALGFLLLLLLAMAFELHVSKLYQKLYTSQTIHERKLAYIHDAFLDKSNMSEIRVFGAAGYKLGKWRELAGKVAKDTIKAKARAQKFSWLEIFSSARGLPLFC